MPVVTYSIEDVTDERIRAIAQAKRLKLSAVVDTAVELLSQQVEFSQLISKTDPTNIKGVKRGIRSMETA